MNNSTRFAYRVYWLTPNEVHSRPFTTEDCSFTSIENAALAVLWKNGVAAGSSIVGVFRDPSTSRFDSTTEFSYPRFVLANDTDFSVISYQMFMRELRERVAPSKQEGDTLDG